MKKFQSNVNRELRRAYPDRRRLECQCLSAIAFVKSEQELLECPIWVLIINVVAMDMLKSKLPPGKTFTNSFTVSLLNNVPISSQFNELWISKTGREYRYRMRTLTVSPVTVADRRVVLALQGLVV